MAFTLVETVDVTSTTSTVTISNIPQDGVDLIIKGSMRHNTTSSGFGFLEFNGTTSNIYGHQVLFGDGNNATATTEYSKREFFNVTSNKSNDTSNTHSNFEIYIPNYTDSGTKNGSTSSVVETSSSTANWSAIFYNKANNVGAITSVRFGSFQLSGILSGSTFSIYKVTAD